MRYRAVKTVIVFSALLTACASNPSVQPQGPPAEPTGTTTQPATALPTPTAPPLDQRAAAQNLADKTSDAMAHNIDAGLVHSAWESVWPGCDGNAFGAAWPKDNRYWNKVEEERRQAAITYFQTEAPDYAIAYARSAVPDGVTVAGAKDGQPFEAAWVSVVALARCPPL